MHPQPNEPRSELRDELAVESQRPPPTPDLRLIPWGTGAVLIGLGLLVIAFGMVRARRSAKGTSPSGPLRI